MPDSNRVYDYNLARLKKKIIKARAEGNKIEEHALGLLAKGIEEGIWTVSWEKGVPIFAVVSADSESQKKEADEKA